MSEVSYVNELIDQDDDFDRWYVEVIEKAGLAADAPVRGCKVIPPYGYALWEQMVARLDARIKATGAENAYFPLFIPRSLIEREADHIEGFAPEVAWVTRGGSHQLEEEWAVRPSSEAIVCPTFARWVQSYRDLPIVLNQWNSVVRWEARPRAFLRSLEFLWQEGHTCHATAAEADERARQMLEVYRAFYAEDLAIPAVPGVKSAAETFAGAYRTYTIEAMMGGKFWALQAGTAHNLADHFGRVFDIRYQDRDGRQQYAHTTSWGLSQRAVGAVVMVHGDDAGLKLPPKVAPVQVVVVPIMKGADVAALEAAISRVSVALRPVARLKVDWREDRTPGYKFNEWELKGVPLRLEIGPRDLAAGQAVLVRRDTRDKRAVPFAGLAAAVTETLVTMQDELLAAATRMLSERMVPVESRAELAERAAANAGWSLAHWCGDAACEAAIKAETRATIRCLPFDRPAEQGVCVVCGRPGEHRAIIARAY